MDFIYIFAIVLVGILIAIYDSIRRVNINIQNQTEEIKKLHDNFREYGKK
ncbi:hypothetical protein [Sporosarcina sp. FA9]